MTDAPSARLRLMTWNIHGGVGPDRRFDLDRIAALIARHRPDILALQEIDTRGRGVECLAPLQGLGIGHLAEARTIVVPDGHYGHVLFSRWPTHDTVLHDLSVRKREPRIAIDTRIDTPMGPLRLVAVHLGLALMERRRQARALARLARDGSGLPTVMMGDFNDWFSFRLVRRALAPVLPERAAPLSFPAFWPMLRLDRIYCSQPGMLADSFTDAEARHASDHLPVIADIVLPASHLRHARPPQEQAPPPHVDLLQQGERS
ncbi:endonuclease/exonuclease/phosphatase family protein [Ancylobacter sp.]|uniref:endonuclease/exonuclease/phosphatase family protein n=1 Tax=Ancylobacter sp. TaxID=1872567 RepID=UPI003D120F74